MAYIVFAGIQVIHISQYPLRTSTVIVPIETFTILLSSSALVKDITIKPKTQEIRVRVNSHLINPSITDCSNGIRVVKIGDIELEPKLYWSDNIVELLSKKLRGVTFVTKKGEFTTSQVLETKDTMCLSKQTILELYDLISFDNIVDIHFSNGGFVRAKFDVLNDPIVIKPLYNGSDKYYVTIKVLV